MQIKTILRYHFHHLTVWQNFESLATYCIDEVMERGALPYIASFRERTFDGGNLAIAKLHVLL